MQYLVLNLVINGIPSIPHEVWFILDHYFNVLNLVINGIPSIHNYTKSKLENMLSFKPCYKWNTFNTR